MNFRLFFLYITHAEYFSNIFAKRQQQELALNSTFLLPLSSALNPSLFLAYLNWRLKIGLNKWLWVASLIGCGGQWQVVFIAWTHAESASFVRNVERGREYNGFPHNYSIKALPNQSFSNAAAMLPRRVWRIPLIQKGS